MRTVSSAASEVASGEAPEQVFYDKQLRDSKQRVVEAPDFACATQIADTHAHLDMLHYPGLALARAAAQKVTFIVSVIDPTEDPAYTLNNLETWKHEAETLLESWSREEEAGVARSESGETREGSGESREDSGEPREDLAKARGDLAEARGEAGEKDTVESGEKDTVEPDRRGEVREGGRKECSEQVKENGEARSNNSSYLAAPDIVCVMGCHPHNASSYDKATEALLLKALASDDRVVGAGEIGLDYHYDNSPRNIQKAVFRRQIQIAHECNSSIILHLREAHEDGLRILREEGIPPKGVLLHCFNLDYATLEPFLELGALVAFGGPLTFKKAEEVRSAAACAPLDRLVTETDCPFMAPVPIRGTICEPASVVFTARVLESLRQEPHALQQAYENARSFFSA